MIPVREEQPPNDTPKELSGWLMRLLYRVNDSIRTHHKYDVLYEIPEKYEAGEVYYFGQAIDATINAEGLWLRKSGSWVQLG